MAYNPSHGVPPPPVVWVGVERGVYMQYGKKIYNSWCIQTSGTEVLYCTMYAVVSIYIILYVYVCTYIYVCIYTYIYIL